jgi:hypothetical protein
MLFTGDPKSGQDLQRNSLDNNGGESEGDDLGEETRVLVGDEDMMVLLR